VVPVPPVQPPRLPQENRSFGRAYFRKLINNTAVLSSLYRYYIQANGAAHRSPNELVWQGTLI
jgi:hypothetical protein